MIVPMGYEQCKGPLEDRFWEVKSLLAQDYSINDIAEKMGINPGLIYGFLKARGWEDFLQPGRRMAENRLRWATVAKAKENTAGIEPGRVQDVIGSFATMVQRNMIRDGWIVDRDDIESAVGEAVTVAINKFDPAREMSFSSYLHLNVSSRIIELQRRLYRDEDKAVSINQDERALAQSLFPAVAISQDESIMVQSLFPEETLKVSPRDDTPWEEQGTETTN